jgi:hypothetical protein
MRDHRVVAVAASANANASPPTWSTAACSSTTRPVVRRGRVGDDTWWDREVGLS